MPKDNRKISVCLTTWEREELLFNSFLDVYNDERVSEIVIVDDCSNLELFNRIKERCDTLPKIKLYRNVNNRQCYHNKMTSISYSSNPFCVIFDSDNYMDKSYIDRLFELSEWNPTIAYMPSFAKPLFSYQAYEEMTFTKENIAFFIDKPMVSTMLNCMNYFVNRDEYLKVWQSDIEPHTADSILQNYNWLVAGNGIYIVPGLHYKHLVHDGSHYKNNVHLTGNIYREIENKIKQLK